MDSGIRSKISLEKILSQAFLIFGGWFLALWLFFPEGDGIQLMLGAMALTAIHTIMRVVYTTQEIPAKTTDPSERYVENE